MIKAPLHNRKTGETRWGDEGLFAEWADNPDVWMWAAFDNEALPREALLEELIGYGRNLKRLRLIFNHHQERFARLSRKDHPFIGRQERHEVVDAFEHTERLASVATLYKELADDLMNGHISVTSHRRNQIMKVLTVVKGIFPSLSLLVGIRGMNFETCRSRRAITPTSLCSARWD
jgi:Mg2+ and Co2+ transporter CorA